MWVVLSPSPPGPFDGISDYAARLAAALDALHPTTLVMAGRDALPAVEDVDAVSLQYFPGTAADTGTPEVRQWLDAIRGRCCPVVVTVHEYWPPPDGTARRWLRRWLARRQLQSVLRCADAIVVAQEISERELRASGLVGARPVAVVPVGSNIAVTAPVGPREGGVVIFGQPAAMDPRAVREVVRWLNSQTPEVRATWVARSAEEVDQWWRTHAIEGRSRVDVRAALPEPVVSAVLRQATVGLALHADGTSARRTTLAALLVHGVPTIALVGAATDRWIAECEGLARIPQEQPQAIPGTIDAVYADPDRRTAMTHASQQCADRHVAWPVIAARYAQLLGAQTRGPAQ